MVMSVLVIPSRAAAASVIGCSVTSTVRGILAGSDGFVGVGFVGSSPSSPEEQEVNENDNENKNNNVVYLILVYCLKNSSVRVL